MKILIIEDEQRTAALIKRLIAQYDNSYRVVEVIDSVEKGREWFVSRTEQPDLVLADIQLSDGTSFDLFEQINLELPVIFITAYNEFALNAFRLNSIDYLLKPIGFADLKQAFDKFIKTRDTYIRLNYKGISDLIYPRTPPFKKRFLVKSAHHLKSITTEEIAGFRAEDGVVFAVLLKGGRHIVDQNLTDLAKVLDPGRFFQVNRNTLVSIDAIGKISNYFNRRVIIQLLPDHQEVIVSRERVQDFKDWLNM